MSFPPYPKYKPSEVEWLGDVPEHWGVKPIKAICSVNDEALCEDTPADQHIEYVEISDVEAGRGIVSTSLMAFSEAPSRARRKIRDGDVLVSTVRTYLRAIAPVENAPENLVASTGFAALRPRSVESSFLGYLCQAEFFISGIICKSVGVSYPAINASELVRLNVPLPTKDEQKTIAAFLDRETAKIDALVEEQKHLIQLLKEKRQAIITHAVTKGLDPNAPMKPSGIEWLGDIPEHWSTSQLRYLAHRIVDGTHFTPTYVDDGVAFLRVTDITGPSVDLDDVKRITPKEHEELIARCKPEKGDLLLSKNGTIGVPRVVTWDWEFSIFVSLCVIKLREALNADFASYVFLSSAIERQINDGAKQSTVTNLHLEKIASFRFPLPPLSEQRTIVDALDGKVRALNEGIGTAQRAVDILQERRSALISAAVIGKIDVRHQFSEAEAA